MNGGQKRTSFPQLLLEGLKSNYAFLYLLPNTIILVIANGFISVFIKNSSSNLFNSILTESMTREELIDHFLKFIAMIALHYMVSSCVDNLRSRMAHIFFRKFIGDAVRETTQMEYMHFHSRGIGKNQENILRSSRAAYECSMILVLDIPSCIIYILIYSVYITFFFHFHVSFILFSALLTSVAFTFMISKVVKANESKCLKVFNESLVYLTDILCNFDIIRAFNKENFEIDRYNRSLDPFSKIFKHSFLIKDTLSFFQKFSTVFPHFMVVLTFLYGFDLGIKGYQIPNYNSLFMDLRRNLLSLRDFCFNFTGKLADLECRYEMSVLNEKSGSAVATFEEGIVLKSAQLYAGDNIIQSGVTLSIRKGEKIAITGVNGAGKSSLLKMLLRFNRCGGTVMFDNVPIEKLSNKSIRSLIAYVPQDPHIFNNTVLYNLSYSMEVKDEEYVYKVCKQYGLDDFFLNMKNGYLTHTGENGKYLSGGQKQRINFVRALVKNAPIIVLDEPTASMDRVSEKDLIEKLVKYSGDKTVIAIVHNLDLLPYFDRIFYFSRGGVHVYDSHDQYLAATK